VRDNLAVWTSISLVPKPSSQYRIAFFVIKQPPTASCFFYSFQPAIVELTVITTSARCAQNALVTATSMAFSSSRVPSSGIPSGRLPPRPWQRLRNDLSIATALRRCALYCKRPRPSTTDHRPSATDHRPSTTDHRPSTTVLRVSTSYVLRIDEASSASPQTVRRFAVYLQRPRPPTADDLSTPNAQRPTTNDQRPLSNDR